MSETWTDRRYILGSDVKIGDIVCIPGRPDVTVREIETSFDGWVKVNPGTQEQRLGRATQYVWVTRPAPPAE
ncbi:hypothetical protein [Streptomyces caniscabiei]|uniref:Uncharacterized protein n=1 Tax=Streptomyces caniscabiei TaxID=2746961 RepID=A0A927KZX7_9ACTN|nr:hypothetical protein [Streptomyces caniscabiei]MBD9723466.1 hypothetical protein [Streptomyces caniscabiei]MDX3725158.1 hypothetical protein [Streptomyces caniscabiei]WEO27036.1 hypothetical protein IHE65_29915 [Streptomyces caniscabiei]